MSEIENLTEDTPSTYGQMEGATSTTPICPLRKNRDIKQSILNPSRKNDGGTSLVVAHTFDQEFSRDKLAKMIILHEYLLNMVEHDGFRGFVNSLQPLFKHVSQTTIRRDILKIYESEKTKTKNSISDNRSRAAITTDMWTSNNHKRGYMVVTAHYIDDSWILRNHIIMFIYVTAPHTAKLLAKELMECLVAWFLERKLSTLTLDNCSVNIAMMDQMKEKLRGASLLMKGELVHMKCSAHILNSIVQEGLEEIQSGIETIRESAFFWTATPKRVEKFEEAKKGLSCSSNKKPVLDCKTRWNSTYLMLTSAIVYKYAFSHLIHTKKKYKKEPSELDWLLAKVMWSAFNLHMMRLR
ncbi:zinc finger BED domain-containing protein RICESLEEPER 2-like [Humulus lupulus]|uniref:zinc finger BED domain-containing protein RICESLEEPER 2-like n=1 Tax=Humulus lupulus TaxID=3486 RepID=UPI002B404783|nr:zinc finger BED domain-containing protein RICESLEEPER 2-like [Humulus lupulus]